jgi:histone H3/H4
LPNDDDRTIPYGDEEFESRQAIINAPDEVVDLEEIAEPSPTAHGERPVRFSSNGEEEDISYEIDLDLNDEIASNSPRSPLSDREKADDAAKKAEFEDDDGNMVFIDADSSQSEQIGREHKRPLPVSVDDSIVEPPKKKRRIGQQIPDRVATYKKTVAGGKSLVIKPPKFLKNVKSATRKVLSSLPRDQSPEVVTWHGDAMYSLQVAAENFLTDILRLASLAAKHAGRYTLQSNDIEFVCKMNDIVNPKIVPRK